MPINFILNSLSGIFKEVYSDMEFFVNNPFITNAEQHQLQFKFEGAVNDDNQSNKDWISYYHLVHPWATIDYSTMSVFIED